MMVSTPSSSSGRYSFITALQRYELSERYSQGEDELQTLDVYQSTVQLWQWERLASLQKCSISGQGDTS